MHRTGARRPRPPWRAPADVARIADGDHQVATKPRDANALDRRAREKGAKGTIVEPGQIIQVWRAQVVTRLKLGFARHLRKLVPRAGSKAVVAAIDAIADGGAKFFRDRAMMLDGEIGNAAPGIELVGLRESLRRAGVEAGAAGAAMVAFGRIGGQVERDKDRAQKQP